MNQSRQSKSPSLLGAVAVLGASLGAVSTAYSDPVRLSNTQMDGVTAGQSNCKICPPSISPVLEERGGDGYFLKISYLLPAVQVKLKDLFIESNKIEITRKSSTMTFAKIE